MAFNIYNGVNFPAANSDQVLCKKHQLELIQKRQANWMKQRAQELERAGEGQSDGGEDEVGTTDDDAGLGDRSSAARPSSHSDWDSRAAGGFEGYGVGQARQVGPSGVRDDGRRAAARVEEAHEDGKQVPDGHSRRGSELSVSKADEPESASCNSNVGVFNSSSSSIDSAVAALVEAGFAAEDAAHALLATGGDLQAAVDVLLLPQTFDRTGSVASGGRNSDASQRAQHHGGIGGSGGAGAPVKDSGHGRDTIGGISDGSDADELVDLGVDPDEADEMDAFLASLPSPHP